jgi:tripartite-type tricarboxylate transporter receptor subunit TctC
MVEKHVTAASSDYADAVPQLKARKLRPLAIVSRARIEPLPDVPTIAETGTRTMKLEVRWE